VSEEEEEMISLIDQLTDQIFQQPGIVMSCDQAKKRDCCELADLLVGSAGSSLLASEEEEEMISLIGQLTGQMFQLPGIVM
jgi:hypothetical protein